MSKIYEILDRNPNWSDLVRPEPGYLSISENHVSFVSASEPDWDVEFRYPLNNEVAGAVDCAEIGEEIVAVMTEDIPDSEEGAWHVLYEVVSLPTPIPVPED